MSRFDEIRKDARERQGDMIERLAFGSEHDETSRAEEIRADVEKARKETQKVLRGEESQPPTKSQERIAVADAEREKRIEEMQQQVELTKAGVTSALEETERANKRIDGVDANKAESSDVDEMQDDVERIGSEAYWYDMWARFGGLSESTSGGGVFNHPFKVSLVSVEFGDDYLTVTLGRLHFWKKDSWQIGEKEITSGDSWTVSDTDGVYTAEYIYAQLIYSGSWTWSLGHGTSNPQSSDDQEQRTWIIAKLETDGSIDQRINQDIYATMGS